MTNDKGADGFEARPDGAEPGESGEEPTVGGPRSDSGAEADTVTFDPDVARAASELRPGDQIGPYRLLEVVGYGGFGVVYLAEQREPIRRRVALKVIKPGMDSASVLARFGAERNALSVMDHANIARVLDGGTTQGGRPYFVMEYVPGESITAYCKRKRMPLRNKLELFAQICQAVQHAHTKGVIHRDLKPSNILVREQDDAPFVKVIDFGVAKALDQRLSEHTLFTAQGHIVGTPEYMAPEQAEGSGQDIDTRADVYSLGVVLYELLTGHRPFDLTDVAWNELTRVLSEVNPPKPSTRVLASLETRDESDRSEARSTARALRSDLDWVVMKCLEKDRLRRYQTAAAVAEDLERFLGGEPLQAGPPTTGYRLNKFVRRHRAALAVGSISAMSVVSATIAIVMSQQRVISAADDLALEQRETIKAQEALVASQQEALAASEREMNLLRFVRAEIVDAARPNDLGSGVSVVDAVARSLSRIDEYDIGGEPAAELFAQFARVLYRAGRDAEAIGFAEDAREFYAEAGIVAGQAMVNRMTLASALSRMARFDEAGVAFEALERDVIEALGPDHSFALSVRNSRALNMTGSGRFAQALPIFQDVRQRREAALGLGHPRTIPAVVSEIDARVALREYDAPTIEITRALFREADEVFDVVQVAGDTGEAGVATAALLAKAGAVFAESGDTSIVPRVEAIATEWITVAADRLSAESSYIAAMLNSRGRLRVVRGDVDAALHDFVASADLYDQRTGSAIDRRRIIALSYVAESLRELGRAEEFKERRLELQRAVADSSFTPIDPAYDFVRRAMTP